MSTFFDLAIVDYRLPTVPNKLPIVDFQLVTRFQLLATNCGKQTKSCRLPLVPRQARQARRNDRQAGTTGRQAQKAGRHDRLRYVHEIIYIAQVKKLFYQRRDSNQHPQTSIVIGNR
jgi:hypothetical protein